MAQATNTRRVPCAVYMCLSLSHPFPPPCTSTLCTLAERDVLHFATLLVFQSVTGGVPFLPQPASQPLKVEGDREELWSRELLSAVRGDISAEAEQCLLNLQREIQVILLYVCIPARK